MRAILLLLLCADWAIAATRNYSFQVQTLSVRRLCKTRSIVAVNGMFPGPTVYANEGDTVLVNVTNNAQYNITIHWHGIRQMLSAWADGPAYVTQCPLQTGQSYLYNFTITKQSGTLFWHAHDTWLRATVHGAIVIYPKQPYPFVFPKEEHVLLLGEWWNSNVEDVEDQALISGGGPAIPDAYTINGMPGPLYNCSSNNDVFVLKVVPGEHYLLRIANAALNQELFFAVANHNLTVLEIDGDYTKPYTVQTILLTPGQSTNVMLHANHDILSASQFYMGASPYMSAQNVPFLNTPALAVLQYHSSVASGSDPVMSTFPVPNDSQFVTTYTTGLKSLADTSVPQTVDRTFFFTIGLGAKPCDANRNCQGPSGNKFTASINNNSFVLPDTALLQAYYFNISSVFTTDFPDKAPNPFNYTATPPKNITPNRGTRVLVIPYDDNVEIIFQDTSILGTENHPIHVHGYSFYIVGQGIGNYNANNTSFNLFDPPKRNTVGVPAGGWAAIRFKADNPGLWYMHCHLEIHTTWGLTMAFIVLNGVGVNQTLPPPPADLPKC